MDPIDLYVPENIEKLLFAEDLVSYVMRGYDNTYEYPRTVRCYRNFVHNAFNGTMRDAIGFLTIQFHQGNVFKFQVLKAAGLADEVNYQILADDLYSRCFSKGFEARKFVYFCAQLSSMAGIFYSFGIRETPKLAVNAITNSLEEFITESGAWKTVNSIALGLSIMAMNFDNRQYSVDRLIWDLLKPHSPPCSTPESIYLSEDEHNSQEEDSHDEDNHEQNAIHQEEAPEMLESVTVNIVTLREFMGFDVEWRNKMIVFVTEDIITSSDEDEPQSERAEDCKENIPQSRNAEAGNENIPSKSAEDVYENIPPSRSAEGIYENIPPSRSAEGVYENIPPSKSAEVVYENIPPSKSGEGVYEA